MKLGELKTAIRSTKGNPLISTTLPDGKTVWVGTMKQSLLEVLDANFEHKGVETGLSLVGGKIIGPHDVISPLTVDMPMDLKEPEPLIIDLGMLDMPTPGKVLTLDLDI